MSETCPKADPESFITGHIMKLDASGDREVWRCANGCGHVQIAPNPFAPGQRERVMRRVLSRLGIRTDGKPGEGA